MATTKDVKKVREYYRKEGKTNGDYTVFNRLNTAMDTAKTDAQAKYDFLRNTMQVDNEGTVVLPTDSARASMFEGWPTREEEVKIPTTKDIITSLDYKDVKDDDGNVTTAQELFVKDYLKKPKAMVKELEKKRPDFGSHSKELLKRAFNQSVYDIQDRDTQKRREEVLNATADDATLMDKALSPFMSLFMNSQKKAYMRGEDPSVGDYASDILGNALMAVPGTGYLKVGSKIPLVGKGVTKASEWAATKAPKYAPRATAILKSVGGNAVAPFTTEGLQYVGDAIDSDRTADYNLGRAVLGTLTNVGVNDILVRGAGGVNKMLLDRQAAREASKDVANALKGKASDKIGMGDAVQAYVVNKLGDQKAAEYAANKLGIGQETVKAWRKDSEDTDNARYVNDVAEKKAILDAAQDEVDAKYLQMIADNPDVLKFSNDTGFKMWLVTRGNDLLRGTSLHRPSWEVQ